MGTRDVSDRYIAERYSRVAQGASRGASVGWPGGVGAVARRCGTAPFAGVWPPPDRSTLTGMWSPRVAVDTGLARAVVDYALARRATLADVAAGRASVFDVCDAQPYLLRAARYHGERTDTECPVCRRERLTHVTYTYGDCFRSEVNGRVRATRDLAALAHEHPEFTVYVVEVCQGCRWNHLVTSYVLGTGQARTGRGRRTRVGEE